MRTKFSGFLTLLLAFIAHLTFAQQKTISGNVTDESGLPLPGATVVVQGTSNGTTTDFDGNYSIQANQGDSLEFSYVGYANQTVAVGASNTINASLQPDNQLEEVVVTAQGIEREARSLGYAVTTVQSDLIEARPEADVARVLNGKVAGVNITSNNGLSGSGTNIIIRGYNTITGSNQPLFVVDGVPFDGGTNTQSNFLDGNTESSRFLDIDPNNIASVNVLKGLSATVLYGNRGRNGVILITTKGTKKGAGNKKLEVTVNQSVFLSDAITPDYQDNYGGGFHQGFGFFFSNWGPRFDRTDDDAISRAGQFTGNGSNGVALLRHPFAFIADQTLVTGFEDLVNATDYEYRPYNGVEDFFRQGQVISTSVSMRGGGENANYNLSYGRVEDEGIAIGNKVTRNNFSLGGNARLSNKISVNGVFNFTRTDFSSPPNAASFGSGSGFDGAAVFGDVLYTPRSVDLTNIPFQAADGRSVYYRSGNDIQNPYWTVNNARATQNVDRFNSNFTVGYEINDWLNASYRVGLDTYTELNLYAQNRGGVDGDVTGILRTSAVRNTIWNHDIILGADYDLTDNLNLKAILGGNARQDTFERDGIESVGQLVFGIQEHFNYTTASSVNSFTGLPIAFESRTRENGVYLDATLGYKDFLFINAVGRNDWTSTLESGNKSIFYPGGSVSFIPTSAFENLSNGFLNYLKLRFAYGSSAGFPPSAFATRDVSALTTRAFVDGGGSVVSSNTVGNRLGNPNLEPETTREFEFGLETELFNRLNLNVSIYQRFNDDLILQQSLDDATGFTFQFANLADSETKGIELDWDLDVFKATSPGDFRFNLAGNFTAYESTVTGLASDSAQELLTQAVIGEAANYAVVDRPYAVLLGTTIQRDANGDPLVGNDGLYLVNNTVSEIGDPNPDWTSALIPSFSYKNVTLSANIQYRHGGDVYSTTAAALVGRGVVDADEAICRECNYILPGVDQNGNPNNVAITATNLGFDTYFAGGINELNIFDGSTIRLQEVSLGYALPQKILEQTPFGSLTFSISGQNLWYKAVNFDSDLNYDTNSSSTGVGNGLGIDFITGPSTRRYGFSVKATF